LLSQESNQTLESVGKLVNLSSHAFRSKTPQQIERHCSQATHYPANSLNSGLHSVLPQYDVSLVVHHLHEPVAPDGIEKLPGLSLAGRQGIADVVAGFLARLASVQLLSAAADDDERSHAHLLPAWSQGIRRQGVGGVAALVEATVRALRLVDPLIVGPVSQCLAKAVAVQVSLV